jgi:hypothetical protein
MCNPSSWAFSEAVTCSCVRVSFRGREVVEAAMGCTEARLCSCCLGPTCRPAINRQSRQKQRQLWQTECIWAQRKEEGHSTVQVRVPAQNQCSKFEDHTVCSQFGGGKEETTQYDCCIHKNIQLHRLPQFTTLFTYHPVNVVLVSCNKFLPSSSRRRRRRKVSGLTLTAVFALATPKSPIDRGGRWQLQLTLHFFTFPYYPLTTTRAECGIKPHSQSWSPNHGNCVS